MLTHRFRFVSRQMLHQACLVLLATMAASVSAAEVQVGARVSALDPAAGSVADMVSGAAGQYEGTTPIVSASLTRTSGIVTSFAGSRADATTGKISGMVLSSVASPTAPQIGNGSASTSASMTGSITLAGAAPGVATFSGVVEGAYNFGNAFDRYLNYATIEADGVIGAVDFSLPSQYFDPFSIAGLFSFPMTWTMVVQPGQTLQMSFYLRMQVNSRVGITEIDLLNTFKLTDISLPPGYSYTSDAEGFLSQFTPSAVPEPATSALLLAGAAVLAWRRRRFAAA